MVEPAAPPPAPATPTPGPPPTAEADGGARPGPAADPHRPAGPPTGTGTAVAVLVARAVVAFGIVVGFNQLATQSPVDAVLPVALISVGLGGLASMVAALLGAERARRAEGPVGFLDPPSLDAGVADFAVGLLAVAAVGWRWGVAAQAALVAVAGLRLALDAEAGLVLTLRRAPLRPDGYRLALVAVEAGLLLAFAGTALADAGVRPFT